MLDFEKLADLDNATISAAKACVLDSTSRCLPEFTRSFKYSHSENGFYPKSGNVEWTTGFWTGQLWLCYELFGNESFRKAAEWQVESFYSRIVNRIDVEHHDMGFLYSPSCVAAYKLTKNEVGRKAAILAADNLVSRFQEKGGFIQAWGPLGAKDNYRLIIDCLLNLPLLFWATGETGDKRYEEVAVKHLDTALKYVLRDDDSTYHTYYFDMDTGKPLKGVTAQGNRDGSAWSRGQSWGVYGSALAYRYLKNDEALDVFDRVTGYFLSHLPDDVIPYWDFDFTNPSNEPRDSSALAITVCGMLEASRWMDKEKSENLKRTAGRLFRQLYERCAVKNPDVSDGLLLHGTYARKSEWNTCNNRGVDECNIWGDYYYLEALVRLSKDWDPYW